MLILQYVQMINQITDSLSPESQVVILHYKGRYSPLLQVGGNRPIYFDSKELAEEYCDGICEELTEKTKLKIEFTLRQHSHRYVIDYSLS